MNLDDILRDATPLADATPPLNPTDRAPFAHLREAFHEAFQEVRGSDSASAPSVRLRTRDFRFDLAHPGAGLSFVAAPSMARGTNQTCGGETLGWQLDADHVALLAIANLPAPTLSVDLEKSLARIRPFWVFLYTGAERVAERVECNDATAPLQLPLPPVGRYRLRVEWQGRSAELDLTVE